MKVVVTKSFEGGLMVHLTTHINIDLEDGDMVATRIINSKCKTMIVPAEIKGLNTIANMDDDLFSSFCFETPKEECLVL